MCSSDLGKVTCDPARYAKARDLIRASGCDVVINMSTGGGAGQTTDEQRMEPVDLAPEIASFDCGSLNFGQGVFVNSPAFLDELALRMRRHGVLPEIECFDASHIEAGIKLWKKGLIEDPPFFDFVLGVENALSYSPQNMMMMLSKLPPEAKIGRAHV